MQITYGATLILFGGALEMPLPQICPVVLCGGSGTRLWPRSRVSKPKPFLPLLDEATLFEATLDRCAGEIFDRPIIVTGAAHVAHVRELSEGRDVKIIIEPTARNTAPAIGLAAERLSADKIIMVFPSDHYISDTDAFIDAATTAAVLAQKGWLVAFGIEATAPETGFGYIRRGDSLSDCTYRIAQFVEKPNLASAEKYLADGNYFWNGGIFCFTAGQYLEQLANSRPAMRQAIKESVSDGRDDGELFYPNSVLFSEIIGESIDYAVMEQAKIGAVVPVSMGWSDIGNWHALQEARNNGAEKNLTRGPAELIDCHNVMTDSDGPRVSVIGLEDVIVVVDGGEVLVTTRAGAQKVGQLAGAREQ